jgi:hypothetical protein
MQQNFNHNLASLLVCTLSNHEKTLYLDLRQADRNLSVFKLDTKLGLCSIAQSLRSPFEEYLS